MPKYVCMGATLKCTFGMTPSTLMVTVPLRPMIQNKPKATIMDFVPLANILPFGMCQSPSNPTVAGHRGSLDAGRERTDYQYARLARQLQADVHVGRKHLHHDARPHVRFAREMNTLFDTPSLLSPNNHPEKSEARFISPNDDWEKF